MPCHHHSRHLFVIFELLLLIIGGDDQWLVIGINQGQLHVLLQLPINVDKSASQSKSFEKGRDQLSSILQLNLTLESTDSGRLDDNQWHRIDIERRSNDESVFEVRIDNSLVLQRSLVKQSNVGEENGVASLFRIHTILVGVGGGGDGGQHANSDHINWPSSDLKVNRLFIGCMAEVIYEADGLLLDILKLSSEGKHGFRLEQSPLYKTNNKSVCFTSECLTSNIFAQTITRTKSESIRLDESLPFIKLRLPPSSLIRHQLTTFYDDEWIQLRIQFSCNQVHPNGLLLLLFDIVGFDKRRCLGLELRNASLMLIVNTGDRSASTQLIDLTNHGARLISLDLQYRLTDIEVLTRARVKIGIKSRSPWKYAKVAGGQFDGIEALTYFGSDLLVGGYDLTTQLRTGRLFAAFSTLQGNHKMFEGCVHSLTIGQSRLDLASAALTIHRRLVGVDEASNDVIKSRSNVCNCLARSSKIGQFEECSLMPSDNAICSNKGLPMRNLIWPTCDCIGTLHSGPKCQTKAPIWLFDGRQPIQARLPTSQPSYAESIELSFRTSQPEGILLATSPTLSVDWLTTDQGHSGVIDTNVDSTLNDHWLVIGVEDGVVGVTYQIADKRMQFNFDKIAVSDNRWHSIRLSRLDGRMTMELDGFTKIFTEAGLNKLIVSIHQLTLGQSTSHLHNTKTPGFVGLIGQAIVNGIPVDPRHTTRSTDNQRRIFSYHSIFSTSGNDQQPDVDLWDILAYPIKVGGNRSTCRAQNVTRWISRSDWPIRLAFRRSSGYPSPMGRQILIILTKPSSHLPSASVIVYLDDGVLMLKTIEPSGYRRQHGFFDYPIDDYREWHTIELHSSSPHKLLIRLDVEKEVELIFPNLTLGRGRLFVGSQVRLGIDSMRGAQLPTDKPFSGCLAGFRLGQSNAFIDLADESCDDNPVGSNCNTRLNGDAQCGGYRCNDNNDDDSCLTGARSTTCDCSGTGFVGPLCNQIGPTLLFNSKSQLKEPGKSHRTDGDRENGRVHFNINSKHSIPLTEDDVFVIGLQTSSHFRSANHDTQSMTLLHVTCDWPDNAYLHLFISQGQLKMEYRVGHWQTQLSIPPPSRPPNPTGHSPPRLDNGHFHRIRGRLTGSQLLVEIDRVKSVSLIEERKTTDTCRPRSIWLGHDPSNSSSSSYFRGYLTGVYFNGFELSQEVDKKKADRLLLACQVTKYGQVKNLPTFQPIQPLPPKFVISTEDANLTTLKTTNQRKVGRKVAWGRSRFSSQSLIQQSSLTKANGDYKFKFGASFLALSLVLITLCLLVSTIYCIARRRIIAASHASLGQCKNSQVNKDQPINNADTSDWSSWIGSPPISDQQSPFLAVPSTNQHQVAPDLNDFASNYATNQFIQSTPHTDYAKFVGDGFHNNNTIDYQFGLIKQSL